MIPMRNSFDLGWLAFFLIALVTMFIIAAVTWIYVP